MRICRRIAISSTYSDDMSSVATYSDDMSSAPQCETFRPMPFQPDRPYNDLPPLPPSVDVETRQVLKACVEARAALAEARMSCQLIPNPTILINLIPILEAQASSEIENIVTTTDRLFRFSNEAATADPATKEALRYRTALRQGFEALAERPLSTRIAVDICRTIKGVDLDIRAVPGTALLNDATGRVVYTPPEGAERLRSMLASWEHFIHEAEDLDPLIRMAMMHYQFEAIHPFTDGNGRTGRILNLLYLVDQRLLDIPILYLSRHIIANRKDYYRLLLAVTTDGAWEDWIIYMLTAVRETSRWTTERIKAIRGLMIESASNMKKRAPRIYKRELVDLIFAQPLLQDRRRGGNWPWAKAGGLDLSSNTRRNWIARRSEARPRQGFRKPSFAGSAFCRFEWDATDIRSCGSVGRSRDGHRARRSTGRPRS